MSQTDQNIEELKQVLVSFIEEQRQFNAEQMKFNAEQLSFNERIEQKIDKVQYYLEESIAQTTKMFIEEQMELKAEVKTLRDQIQSLDELVAHLMSELSQLKLKVS